jgi:hypothetical protein
MADLSTLGSLDYSSANATQVLQAILDPYGLGSLATDMFNAAKGFNYDATLTTQWLRSTPQYQQRFPGMQAIKDAGLAPITEQDYVNYENTVKSTLKSNGIPDGIWDSPDEIAQFMGHGVSPTELQDRINNGVVAAQNAPQYVKDALFNYYGIDQGHLTAYWLDPTKTEATLQQQAAAAQIGGAATYSGFGGVARDEAEQLQKQGVTGQQALQGFGTLSYDKQLLTSLPGEAPGSDIDRSTQLAAVANSPAAQAALQAAADRRKAVFGGGGDFGTGSQGVSGLADVR